jgi:hypothetical protein
MKKNSPLIAAVIATTSSFIAALPLNAQEAGQTRTFPQATIRFEQNATDGDVEVVIEVSGRREGLTTLSVEGPDGRMVVDFASDEEGAGASGVRQFLFESPEPTDIESLKAAWPEGAYTFEGATESGTQLRGKATLSHNLPPTAKLVFPPPEMKNVPIEKAIIGWSPMADVAAFHIELEQEDSGEVITAKLSPKTTTFVVPHGFLQPATEYKIGLGTESREGNISFIETSFTTSAAKP